MRLTGKLRLVYGMPAFPVTLAAPRVGYRLKLRGKGGHKIQLTFQTSVSSAPLSLPRSSSGRTKAATPYVSLVRFGIPRLVQSRLIFQAGPERQLSAGAGQARCRGAGDEGDVSGEAATGGRDLCGDCSRSVPRRDQHVKPPSPPLVEYREAYLWSLATDASTLTAWIRYRISGGRDQHARRRPAARDRGPLGAGAVPSRR